MLRGTAQNPDVFFQAREAINPFYRACPTIVQDVMDRFARRTGRSYRLFEYVGDPEAGAGDRPNGFGRGRGRRDDRAAHRAAARRSVCSRCGLFRPFDGAAFAAALPKTTRAIAVLDRTKEPGSIGEPLYLDVVTALQRGAGGGRHRRPMAAHHRRAIRLVVEGIHARDGEGGLRRTQAGARRRITSRSESTTT